MLIYSHDNIQIDFNLEVVPAIVTFTIFGKDYKYTLGGDITVIINKVIFNLYKKKNSLLLKQNILYYLKGGYCKMLQRTNFEIAPEKIKRISQVYKKQCQN